MIMVFFISLALLTWQICRELERRDDPPPKAVIACGGCGGEAEHDWLVCSRCSRLLQEHCPGCGEVHAREDHFCPWCGIGETQRLA